MFVLRNCIRWWSTVQRHTEFSKKCRVNQSRQTDPGATALAYLTDVPQSELMTTPALLSPIGDTQKYWVPPAKTKETSRSICVCRFI